VATRTVVVLGALVLVFAACEHRAQRADAPPPENATPEHPAGASHEQGALAAPAGAAGAAAGAAGAAGAGESAVD
jgi:hypothetical protein